MKPWNMPLGERKNSNYHRGGMKLLIDMNLSPQWVPLLKDAGHEATHWSAVGDPRAPDSEVMHWAREHGYYCLHPRLRLWGLVGGLGSWRAERRSNPH